MAATDSWRFDDLMMAGVGLGFYGFWVVEFWGLVRNWGWLRVLGSKGLGF